MEGTPAWSAKKAEAARISSDGGPATDIIMRMYFQEKWWGAVSLCPPRPGAPLASAPRMSGNSLLKQTQQGHPAFIPFLRLQEKEFYQFLSSLNH